MFPSSADHDRPIVAEMEEALTSVTVETELSNGVGLVSGQGRRDGRLAVLEDLRDGGTPIDLEFILQHLSYTHLSAREVPGPGVTAIAAPSNPRTSARPLSQDRAAVANAAHGTRAVNRIRILYGALAPSIRQTGHRVGYFGRAGAHTFARVGHAAIGGIWKGSRASRAAAHAAARAIASGAAVAARQSVGSVAAAGRAMYCAVTAMATQPARFGRLLRRIQIRTTLAAPLGATLRRITTHAAVPANRSGDTQTPGGATVARTVATATATTATSVSGTSVVSEPPFIRARRLATEPEPEPEATARIATTSGGLRPPAPYELAAATPVPTLLMRDVVSAGIEGKVVTTELSQPPLTAQPVQWRKGAAAAGSKARRRVGTAAAATVLHIPARIVRATAAATVIATKYTATATMCAFFPRSCRLVGLAALLSGPSLPLPLWLPGLRQLRQSQPIANPLLWGPMRKALSPLAPLRGPFTTFGVLRLVTPLVAPAVWRSLMYWQRTLPIMTRYMLTSKRAAALRTRGQFNAAEELWQRQHEWGAGAIFDMLADLKGFYLKLGQILASKTDMLPQPYTESLSRLLDRLPPAPYHIVRRTIASDLGAPPDLLFRELDPFPLASATIAQVHRGRLPDGRPVVVKVQHGPARRMMRSDLANLSALSRLMDTAGLRLGFDHGSLVREYNVQVPLEFDFAREARVASAIRGSLASAAETFPALRRVVVPRMVPSHSSGRVLTMEYLDGVPLLDIAEMDLSVRHGLMTSLILAYGIMILRDGLFHSDPHPGNVLAMRRRRAAAAAPAAAVTAGFHGGGSGRQLQMALDPFGAGGAADLSGPSSNGVWIHPSYQSDFYHNSPSTDTEDLQVALVDFGQAKQLSATSRVRYAMLVAAMAVRDDDLVLAVAGELGLVVNNCSNEFAAIAAYILFDTRMDFPEAHMGLMDPEAHEFRTAKVPSLPQDLFMIMRTITLLRGLLNSLHVDVSSAQLWRPLALQVLADLTPIHNGPAMSLGQDVIAPDTAAQIAADLAAVEPLDFGGGSGSGGAGLPPPLMTATVVAAASRVGGVASGGGGSRRTSLGSGGSSGGGAAADRAAAEAARKEREAAAVERRRAEREAAAAARREEEARRRAEWEEANRRKREEREAKAERQRQLKEAVEARKMAERMEREARKRAEIEASNTRRKAEHEAAEARRQAEREAAAIAEAERRRSRGFTPERTQQGSAANQLLRTSPNTSLTSTASSKTLMLPTPPSEAPRLATMPGIIHSPIPVRLGPYGGPSSLASRMSQISGGVSSTGSASLDGIGLYGTSSGASGAIESDAAAAATANTAAMNRSPGRESSASAGMTQPSSFSLTGNRTESFNHTRPSPALTTTSTTPWGVQSLLSVDTANKIDGRIALSHSISLGAVPATATTTNAPPRDPNLTTALGIGGSGVNAGTSGSGSVAATTPASLATAATRLSQTGGSTSSAARARASRAAASDVRGNGFMDDLTTRLVARAQQFTGVTDGTLTSYTSAVQASNQSGLSATLPLKVAQSVPSPLPSVAATGVSLPSASGANDPGSETLRKMPGSYAPQIWTSTSQMPPTSAPPPQQQQQQQPLVSPRPSISLTPAQHQQLRLESQLEQLQQQLLQLQLRQRTSPTNVSPTPGSPGVLPPSPPQPASAQQQVVAGSAPRPSPPPSPPQLLSSVGGTASSGDIVAQARALLETTRKLVPSTTTSPSATGSLFPAVTSASNNTVGSGGNGGAATPTAAAGITSSDGGGGSDLPMSVIVGGSSGGGGGGGHGSSPGVGGTSDHLVSKRAGHNPSPPAMFLPTGMRQVGGGTGGGPNTVRKVPGDVSPTLGAAVQASTSLSSEIEPAPQNPSTKLPQNQYPSEIGDVAPTTPDMAVNGSSAGLLSGGVESRFNLASPVLVSVDLLPGTAAPTTGSLTPTAAAATAAVGTGGGSGWLPLAAGMAAPTGADGSTAATAAAAGRVRTGDGMLLHSDEDYGMWLAQRQPASETSVVLQNQPQSHLQPQSQAQPLLPTGAPAAAVAMVAAVPPPPMPEVAATAASQLPAVPLVPMVSLAATATITSPGSVTTGGAAAKSAVSSVGSTAMGPGGTTSSGARQRSSGIESVKKGLSRIGRKIVSGLNP